MVKVLSGAVGIAVVVGLAYMTVMGGFLGFSLHTKSDVDLCASGELQLLQMQANRPRDFAAEKALQDKVDRQCETATKEAKFVEGILPR
jgi:hypothetical protein